MRLENIFHLRLNFRDKLGYGVINQLCFNPCSIPKRVMHKTYIRNELMSFHELAWYLGSLRVDDGQRKVESVPSVQSFYALRDDVSPAT